MNVRSFSRLAQLVRAVVFIGALVPALLAQDITKGSIAGSVLDASGAPIPGAKVDLSGPVGQKTTTTDSSGVYTFPNLQVGSGYVLTATKTGFGQSKATDISVGVNQRTTVDVRLDIGASAQSVDVTESGTATIDLATTTIGANLDESLYKNVPVGRSVSSVVSLAPGVSSSGGAGVSNPSINGASGLENQYIINGANVTDPGYGGFGTYTAVFGSLGSGITFDFIQEVQVKSGGFEAQYGEALGGVVNIITKSGSNKFHGDLYGYFQPEEFAVSNPNPNLLTTSKTTWFKAAGRYDFGGDLGGYIKKDKLFFYGGFNPTYSQSFRQADPLYTNSTLGEINVQNRTLNYAGKINWNVASNHQLEGSVFGDPANTPTNFARISSLSSNNNLSQSSIDFGSRTWTTRYNGSFGPTWLLTVTYSDYFSQLTETPRFNGYQISDITPSQEGPGSNQTYNGLGLLQNTEAKNHEVNVTGTHLFNLLGGHTVDLGYQYEDVPYSLISRYTGADFVLPTDPALGAASGKTVFGAIFRRTHQNAKDKTSPIVYSLLRGNYSSPNIATGAKYNAGFIQDSWTIGKKLTIKPGIRFEQQEMSGGALRYVFAHNWAPRIGVIYDPTGNRKGKLFASWGRFYEKIPSDISVRSFSFESSDRGVLYKDQGAGNAAVPSIANYIPGGVISQSGGPDALTTVAGGTASQYQDEVVAGYEHEFHGYTFTGRFVYRELKRILEDVSGINITQNNAGVAQAYVVANPSAHLDIFKNADPCTSGPTCDTTTGYTAGGGNLLSDGRPDGFSNPSRVYKAMELIVSKRLTSNFQVYGSYRLSKLYGNFEGSFRNDNNQSDPNISSLFDFTNTDGLLGYQQAAGILPNNRTHQFKLFSNYQWKAFNFGASWLIQSGTPLTPLAAHPAYGNAGEIPTTPRGSLGTTPVTFPLDLHADYTYKLGETKRIKLLGDFFNVGNQTRLTAINTWTETAPGSPNLDYLKPGTNVAAQPYQNAFFARFAVRFEF
jgi:hypothetical protein